MTPFPSSSSPPSSGSVAVGPVAGCRDAPRPPGGSRQGFAQLVERLSEPAGYFDTDNLVSNETAYLHVIPGLHALGVHGGVYLGVGPEQNFSYIAEIDPEMAILIDIRRDNLLLHLLFKAMFESAGTRIEYLCLLYGRPAPPDPAGWRRRDLPDLLAWLDRTPLDTALHARQHLALMQRIARYGVPLSEADRATIRRFHDTFAFAGPDLRFTTIGRSPGRDYPTARRLYLETDLEGHRASYLASEDRWARVRRLERADRVIPVVGDLAGEQAMPAIAKYLRETHRTVSAYYVSNVEFYLFGPGTFPAFVANVRALPAGPSTVLIRSWFDNGRRAGNSTPGQFSTQQLQTFDRFFELTSDPNRASYWTMVTDTVLTSRPLPARP